MQSKVFGEANTTMEGALKNPNQFSDAVIYEAISSLPAEKVSEFIKSNEAKFMLNEGLISPELLDRLTASDDNTILKTTVCHMAKENGDPAWDALVKARIEERRIMNELLEKYGEEAKPVAEAAIKNFIEGRIPEYFRHN